MSDDGERKARTLVPVVTRIETVELPLTGALSWSQLVVIAARIAERQRGGYTAAKVVITFEKEVAP